MTTPTDPTAALKLARDALTLAQDQLAGDRLGLIACHAWPAGSGVIPEHDRAGTQALRDYNETLSAVTAALAAIDALPSAPSGEPAEPTRADLIAALTFYAHGGHMNLSGQSAWDTVSGEPPNWWCDEAGTATIEDGSLAKMALSGDMNAGHFAALERGDDVCIEPGAGSTTPQAAPAPLPLTDDQLDAMRQASGGGGELNFATLREFRVIARAVERAHGITTNPAKEPGHE